MNNLSAPARATSGPPGTGPGMATSTITTGCREHGGWLRKSVSCGLPDTGPGVAADSCSTKASGAQWLVSTAESITATAISDTAMKAGVGTATVFTTIAPSTT